MQQLESGLERLYTNIYFETPAPPPKKKIVEEIVVN